MIVIRNSIIPSSAGLCLFLWDTVLIFQGSAHQLVWEV
jgi:hypothetical protein